MHNVTVTLPVCVHALSSQCPVQCKFESAKEPFSCWIDQLVMSGKRESIKARIQVILNTHKLTWNSKNIRFVHKSLWTRQVPSNLDGMHIHLKWIKYLIIPTKTFV